MFIKMKNQSYNNFSVGNGFTLLELLLVILILGTLALSALSITQNSDSQIRFEDTRNRLEMIKKAVVGSVEQTVNGQPNISGFVADVGQLPACLKELVENTTDCGNTITGLTFNTTAGLWSGWNGPYLSVIADAKDGAKRFRDGWQNVGTDDDFGWIVSANSTILTVQSKGLDGVIGGSDDYEKDYPSSGDLVEQADHFALLPNNIAVTFSASSASKSLCLKLWYPSNGSLIALESDDHTLAVSTSEQTINFSIDNSKRFPIGIRAIGVYEYNTGTSTCTDNLYPSTAKPLIYTFIPRTVAVLDFDWVVP